MKISASISWLYNSSKGLHGRILMSSAAGLILVGCSLLFVYLSKRLVDIATGSIQSDLGVTITLFVLCIVAQVAINTFISRLDSMTFVRMKNSLRHRLFSRYISSTWNSNNPLHSGDIANRLDADVRLSSEAACNYFPQFISSLAQITASFVYLLILEPALAWIMVFIMPLVILISRVFIRRLKGLVLKIRNTEGSVQSHIQESVQNYINIKTLEHSQATVENLDSLQATLVNNERGRINFSTFSHSVLQFGFMAGYATAFLWGIMGLMDKSITYGVMTAFLQLVNQLQRPIVDFTRQLPIFVRAIASVERLTDIDTLESENLEESTTLSGVVGLEFRGVTFSYPSSERKILNDFSYNFSPGSITAILGETGVGKSTTVRLMLSLLKPDSGNISIYNSHESMDISPATRSNFIYVPQGNSLMSGTIRQNILLGKPTASDQEIAQVIDIAAAQFVYDLPLGLNTQCNERGGGLSEGQAQRIAIARALLRPGSIMLLDEPTSSLDPQTQERFIDNLKLASKDKTIIIITHRSSILRLCSQVVTLN